MCMNLGLQINRRAHENTALGTVQIDRSILDAAIRVLYSMPVENVSGPQKGGRRAHARKHTDP